MLERGDQGQRGAKTLIDDLPLFAMQVQTVAAVKAPKTSAVEARLTDIHPDALTPREALALLYELRELLPEK